MAQNRTPASFSFTTEVALFALAPEDNQLSLVLVEGEDGLTLPRAEVTHMRTKTALDDFAVAAVRSVLKDPRQELLPEPWQTESVVQNPRAAIGYTAVARQAAIRWDGLTTVSFGQLVESEPIAVGPMQRGVIKGGVTSLQGRIGWPGRARNTQSTLYGLMPAEFTLSDLRTVVEAVHGAPIDKANFNARAPKIFGLTPTGTTRQDVGRPAQLWRLPDPSRD